MFLMFIGFVGWGVIKVLIFYCGLFKNMECSKEKFIIDELFLVVLRWFELIYVILWFMCIVVFFFFVMMVVLSLFYYYCLMVYEY